MRVAVVPAKPLELAKTRLATLVSSTDRAAITIAMFEDVLAALRAAQRIDRIFVVTADRTLAGRARAASCLVVDEGAPRGLNGAVAIGTNAALALGAQTIAVLLSDVPLVRGADVDDLLDRTPKRGALVVPSKEGLGTNALIRQPGTVFGPAFGGRSLRRHLGAAERAAVPCTIRQNPRVAFDVDTPDDLRVLAARDGATATHREIARLGVVPLPSPAG